jgi:hypothetical protein
MATRGYPPRAPRACGARLPWPGQARPRTQEPRPGHLALGRGRSQRPLVRRLQGRVQARQWPLLLPLDRLRPSLLAGQRLGRAFGSSASCTTIWDTSTWSRKPCNPSTTPSARGCHPCLRYVLSPMCPGWTKVRLAEGEELAANILQSDSRRCICDMASICSWTRAAPLEQQR